MADRNRKRQYLPPARLFNFDWRSWGYPFDFTLTWFSYQVAITAVSITGFFFGLIQLINKLVVG